MFSLYNYNIGKIFGGRNMEVNLFFEDVETGEVLIRFWDLRAGMILEREDGSFVFKEYQRVRATTSRIVEPGRLARGSFVEYVGNDEQLKSQLFTVLEFWVIRDNNGFSIDIKAIVNSSSGESYIFSPLELKVKKLPS